MRELFSITFFGDMMSVPDTQYLKWSRSHDRALYENVTRKDKIQTDPLTVRSASVCHKFFGPWIPVDYFLPSVTCRFESTRSCWWQNREIGDTNCLEMISRVSATLARRQLSTTGQRRGGFSYFITRSPKQRQRAMWGWVISHHLWLINYETWSVSHKTWWTF